MAPNVSDTSQMTDNNNEVVRDELINTAVKFLQNPKVQNSTLEHRQAFLRSKGLSEKEISLAFGRASISPPAQHFPSQQHMAVPMPGHLTLPPQSGWSRFRETLNNIALVSGIIYGLYVLYKRYIAPFLFGAKRKPTIEDSIKSLDTSVKTSVQELQTNLQKVQCAVDKVTEEQELARNHATAKQMQELKNEIVSLKGLLLNRKQFTASAGDVVHPSIPDWQLRAEQEAALKGDEEAGSGSEAEVVTNNGSNNGSDSSLEMIKE